jgi:hypothetical protein
VSSIDVCVSLILFDCRPLISNLAASEWLLIDSCQLFSTPRSPHPQWDQCYSTPSTPGSAELTRWQEITVSCNHTPITTQARHPPSFLVGNIF